MFFTLSLGSKFNEVFGREYAGASYLFFDISRKGYRMKRGGESEVTDSRTMLENSYLYVSAKTEREKKRRDRNINADESKSVTVFISFIVK